MTDTGIPQQIIDHLRTICMALPETREEVAWTGVRWCIRTKTFAHALRVAGSWPPAYASVVAEPDPTTVVTFQTDDPLLFRTAPPGSAMRYFGFGRNTVGVILDDRTDWHEIAEWITDSYRRLAPKHLGERPGV